MMTLRDIWQKIKEVWWGV